MEVALTMQTMLEATGVPRTYNGAGGVRDASLTVLAGERVAIVGKNGAGKSTLLRTCIGLLAPERGTVTLAGHDVHRARAVAMRFAGYVDDDPTYFETLTLAEAFLLNGDVRGIPRSETNSILQALARPLELGALLERRTKELSFGERKRAALALAMAHRPRILLLDEPLTGMDPEVEPQAVALLAESARAGTAVVISTHHLAVAMGCDRVVVLRGGHIARVLPGEAARADGGSALRELFRGPPGEAAGSEP
jgi:ABC-2 type transport system ATP-binding protein